MTIPKKVKVGGVTYKVVVTSNLANDEAGSITTDKALIKILKGEPTFMQVTFLHEIFHAINMEFKETDIEFLAQAMNQVIVDNPIIFKEQKKEIKKETKKKKPTQEAKEYKKTEKAVQQAFKDIDKGGEQKHGK